MRLTHTSEPFTGKTGLDAGRGLLGAHRAQPRAPPAVPRLGDPAPARRRPLRWLALSGEPVFDAEGMFQGYRGVGRNITAQKRAEQLLRLEHAVARALAQARRRRRGPAGRACAPSARSRAGTTAAASASRRAARSPSRKAGSRASPPPSSSSAARAPPGRAASRCSPSRRLSSRPARSPPSPSRRWREGRTIGVLDFLQPQGARARPAPARRLARRSAARSASSCSASRPRRRCARARSASAA